VSESLFWPRFLMLPVALTSALLAAADQVAVAATPPYSPDIFLLSVNLVVNPSFDSGISGWTNNGTPANVFWDPTNDQAGSGNSGSAFAMSPSLVGSNGLYQCINLPADWRSRKFSFSYWTFTGNSAPLGNGNAEVVVLYFDTPDCGMVDAIDVSEYFSSYTDARWVQSVLPVFPPDLTQSVEIFLLSVNTAPGAATGVNFDSVFFGYTPATGTCGEDPTIACLDKNRFQVTAAFAQPCATGSTSADGVQISTVGGFLWCFDPTNPEIFVKVLNACSLTSSYWVFISGLTNVGVTVSVTDTKTGQQKSYTNPNDTAFVSIEDTAGLKVCP
jgi:hypothetical protein